MLPNISISKHDNIMTAEDAVFSAAIKYKLNISHSNYPISEYLSLRNNSSNYTPIDKNFALYYRLNRDAFNIEKNWFPYFNQTIYNPNILNAISKWNVRTRPPIVKSNEISKIGKNKLFNITTYDENMTATEVLHFEYLSESFYPGHMIGTKNVDSPIDYDTINELTSSDVVCYGIRSENSFIAFKYSELVQSFTRYIRYINPNGGIFNDFAMKKLFHIMPSKYAKDMTDIKNRISSIDGKFDSFKLFFDSLKNADKSRVVEMLDILIKAGMAMRGWMGHGPYPLSNVPMQTEHDLINIEQRVILYIGNFQDLYIKMNDDIKMYIDTLPLVKFGELGRYETTVNDEAGKTLRERLIIITTGDVSQNINSCIRMSSNYIVGTCYRALELVGQKPQFNIAEFRYVS